MDKKLIFVPFAHDPNKRTGANMERTRDAFTIYCKNFCTALVSLKLDNPECDVALVTNSEIPERFSNILSSFGIYIYIYSYEFFTFPGDYPWSLAFYKLSALRSVVTELDYDYYCYVDADVISNRPLDPIWEECKHRVLLYDASHGLQTQDYRSFISQVQDFTCQEQYITHYGGEFFAANRQNCSTFLDTCQNVYEDILSKNYRTSHGDEFILSIAASRNIPLTKNASPYIFRFWTGQFYLTSTRYQANPVCLMHLPTEKGRGIAKIFDRYVSKGSFPDKQQIYRLCNIKKPYYLDTLKIWIKRLLGLKQATPI